MGEQVVEAGPGGYRAGRIDTEKRKSEVSTGWDGVWRLDLGWLGWVAGSDLTPGVGTLPQVS